MNLVTDLADQAVILPVIVGVAVTVAVLGWPRGALAWVAATGAAFGLMLLLKLVFLGCGSLLGFTRISSPSGHACAAALVTGGLVAMFVASRSWVVVAAIVAGIIIGTTRVILGAHSTEEVILGGAVGVAGALLLHAIAGPRPPLRLLPIAVVVAVIVFAMHGTRLPAEVTIRQTATLIGRVIPACHWTPPAWKVPAAPARTGA